jgi:hypothetical protein
MTNGIRHPTNARGGKAPSTIDGHHNRHAGHAKALRALGKRKTRRRGRAARRETLRSLALAEAAS